MIRALGDSEIHALLEVHAGGCLRNETAMQELVHFIRFLADGSPSDLWQDSLSISQHEGIMLRLHEHALLAMDRVSSTAHVGGFTVS